MKILILDDHSLFSKGLGKILEDNYQNLSCVYFCSIADLQTNVTSFNSFDLLISDIELPGEDIFDFLSQLRKSNPNLPVLIVSMHNKLSVIRKCKELKIPGYILKDDYDLVNTAVEQLLSSKEYYSKRVLETLSILNEKDKLLTPKEEEIIHLLVKGKDNKAIAKDLFISYNTVKTHRKNINRKLGINKTLELLEYYNENYI
ncbi:MAG: response regulator transcription factor [Bacteroidales bacterium]|nr:response regulator transcription factor [Bacteroidales bacterium]